MATLQSMVMAVSIAGITVLSRGVDAQIVPERRITAGVLQLTHRFEAEGDDRRIRARSSLPGTPP